VKETKLQEYKHFYDSSDIASIAANLASVISSTSLPSVTISRFSIGNFDDNSMRLHVICEAVSRNRLDTNYRLRVFLLVHDTKGIVLDEFSYRWFPSLG